MESKLSLCTPNAFSALVSDVGFMSSSVSSPIESVSYVVEGRVGWFWTRVALWTHPVPLRFPQ